MSGARRKKINKNSPKLFSNLTVNNIGATLVYTTWSHSSGDLIIENSSRKYSSRGLRSLGEKVNRNVRARGDPLSTVVFSPGIISVNLPNMSKRRSVMRNKTPHDLPLG